jgi:hypothetical protein
LRKKGKEKRIRIKRKRKRKLKKESEIKKGEIKRIERRKGL